MQLRSLSIALALATTIAQAAPAAACDLATFDTPYDLHDQATTVALVKVVSLGTGKATFSLVEALKGSLAATVTIDADLRSTCSPGLSKGAQGVVYLDATGRMMGAYNGFQRDKAVIATLRKYGAATTAADGAAALVDAAVSRDWTRSFEAAYALSNRVPMVLALDAAARDRVIKRLAKVGEQHTLIRLAARLHDARVRPLQKRRKFEDGETLTAVIAGRFDGESDTARLADTIAASGTSTADRVAALERCELIRGITLALFTDYASTDVATADQWDARASACRNGKPVP